MGRVHLTATWKMTSITGSLVRSFINTVTFVACHFEESPIASHNDSSIRTSLNIHKSFKIKDGMVL